MNRSIIRRLAGRLPGLGTLLDARDRVETELSLLGHPPGHFYSPIPNAGEVERHFAAIEKHEIVEIPGIDLNASEQKIWLQTVAQYYPEHPFPMVQTSGYRYYFKNSMFLESDALFLYGMLRAIQPSRVVEVGSGFSSAVMLDTNQRHLFGSARFTFIEPHPQRLYSLLSDADRQSVNVISQPVQEASECPWESLQSGDILFVDSSHVSKCGSDVNFLFNEVVPRLADGVYVHIHDISYPFEYPKSWVMDRRWAWNEAYLLRAFLQFNSCFKIVAWVPFINRTMGETVSQLMPLCRNDYGGSFWMRKLSS